jgi:hypothetical protein
MDASSSEQPSFEHHIAIQLSRLLNLPTNDLLAKRVIDIAGSTSLRAFENGQSAYPATTDLVR